MTTLDKRVSFFIMTLVVAWAGFDDKSRHRRKVSSLYIAADSRINWKGTSRYDGHQKVFASVKHPEIFGFCGDVTFCNMAISQILAKIDSDILFGPDEQYKSEVVAKEMQRMLSKYPNIGGIANSEIIYGTRIAKEFHFFLYRFKNREVVVSEWPITEEKVRKIYFGGSGKDSFNSNWIDVDHEKDNNHLTTRNVYHCVARTVEQCADSQVGGVSQLVGLYRGGNGRQFGIVKDGDYYFGGQPCKDLANLTNVEWRNENFERVDVVNGKLVAGAHPQPIR